MPVATRQLTTMPKDLSQTVNSCVHMLATLRLATPRVQVNRRWLVASGAHHIRGESDRLTRTGQHRDPANC